MRKPDPRIFELSLARLDVEPSAAAFIDDAPGNVAGARAVGLQAVLIGSQPHDEPAAIAALESLISG
jgi:FMN phosphatase YigB (HAD superfamily)